MSTIFTLSSSKIVVQKNEEKIVYKPRLKYPQEIQETNHTIKKGTRTGPKYHTTPTIPQLDFGVLIELGEVPHLDLLQDLLGLHQRPAHRDAGRLPDGVVLQVRDRLCAGGGVEVR